MKYLASPAAQTKLMELKASMPVNKEVLAGPFATSFDGAKVLADAIAYAHLKPSFKGYNELTTALQTELDANVFNEPEEDAPSRRSPTCSRSSTGSSPASDRRPDPPDRPGERACAAPPDGGAAGRWPARAAGRWRSSRRP